MTRCDEVQPLLYPWLDDELGAERAALVASHLEACPECERRAATERRFIERIREAGRERAPEGLRTRVDGILAGGATPEGDRAVVPLRSGTRRWLLPVVAAAAVVLLVVRPWGEPPPFATASSFAADFEAHALVDPSENPFPDGMPIPPPPELDGASLAGLSECVIDGSTYAHYTFRIDGLVVSVFLPLEDTARPAPGEARPGGISVVTIEATVDRPPAVLVSGDLGPDELRTIWPDA